MWTPMLLITKYGIIYKESFSNNNVIVVCLIHISGADQWRSDIAQRYSNHCFQSQQEEWKHNRSLKTSATTTATATANMMLNGSLSIKWAEVAFKTNVSKISFWKLIFYVSIPKDYLVQYITKINCYFQQKELSECLKIEKSYRNL